MPLSQETIIRRLRGIVRRNNWDVQKLAAETGVEVHHVRHLRHNYYKPTPDVLRVLEIFVRRYESLAEGKPFIPEDTPGRVIFCAMDTTDMDRSLSLVDELYGHIGGIKIGIDFFTTHGIAGVKKLKKQAEGLSLMLDLKLHDIPHTVQQSLETILPLAPDYITLHAAGGQKMLRYARRTVERFAARAQIQRPKLLAVSLLTSLDERDMKETGINNNLDTHVVQMGKMAEECGMDGLLCAAGDVGPLRSALGPEIMLFASAIRPHNFIPPKDDDQKRTMNAVEAMKSGADYLIIGRPITNAPYPVVAADQVVNRLALYFKKKEAVFA